MSRLRRPAIPPSPRTAPGEVHDLRTPRHPSVRHSQAARKVSRRRPDSRTRASDLQDCSTPGARSSSSMRFVARALSAAESRAIDTSLPRCACGTRRSSAAINSRSARRSAEEVELREVAHSKLRRLTADRDFVPRRLQKLGAATRELRQIEPRKSGSLP